MKKLYEIVLFLSAFTLISCSTGKNEKVVNVSNSEIIHDFNTYRDYKRPKLTTKTLSFNYRQFCYLSCPIINSDKNLILYYFSGHKVHKRKGVIKDAKRDKIYR